MDAIITYGLILYKILYKCTHNITILCYGVLYKIILRSSSVRYIKNTSKIVNYNYKMNPFDFPTEMVYGKRHLHVLQYNVCEYNFVSLVKNIFNIDDLTQLHIECKQEYQLFKEFGKDNITDFHDYLDGTLQSKGGNDIKQLFNKFITEVILPYLNIEEAKVQSFPTFRIHFPNNVVVDLPHHDHDLGHPIGVINFTIALTNYQMCDCNIGSMGKMPRSEVFTEKLEPNNCICFNGNLCQHYNQVNTTGQTRMSMDFRVLPVDLLFSKEV